MGAMMIPLMEKTVTSEKRKYPRFSADFPVKYSTTNSFFKSARVDNASEGGLLVCLPEKMHIGQQLALKLIFLSRSGLDIVETVVQVIWMGIHLRKDWTWDYRTGVKFEDISPEDMTTLKNFLTRLAPKPSPAS
jgi:c-di-GMP-binding flagellar brake protein YcgR